MRIVTRTYLKQIVEVNMAAQRVIDQLHLTDRFDLAVMVEICLPALSQAELLKLIRAMKYVEGEWQSKHESPQ